MLNKKLLCGCIGLTLTIFVVAFALTKWMPYFEIPICLQPIWCDVITPAQVILLTVTVAGSLGTIVSLIHH